MGVPNVGALAQQFPDQDFGNILFNMLAQQTALGPFQNLALPLFQSQLGSFNQQQGNQAQLAAAGIGANASLGAAGIGAQATLGAAGIGAQGRLDQQVLANRAAQAQLQAQIDSDFALAQFGDQNAAFRLQSSQQQQRDLATQATNLELTRLIGQGDLFSQLAVQQSLAGTGPLAQVGGAVGLGGSLALDPAQAVQMAQLGAAPTVGAGGTSSTGLGGFSVPDINIPSIGMPSLGGGGGAPSFANTVADLQAILGPIGANLLDFGQQPSGGFPTLAGALNAPQTPAAAPFLLGEGGAGIGGTAVDARNLLQRGDAAGGNALLQQLAGFAQGGNIRKGNMGIVGEAGPELAVATKKGTQIIPLMQGGGFLGDADAIAAGFTGASNTGQGILPPRPANLPLTSEQRFLQGFPTTAGFGVSPGSFVPPGGFTPRQGLGRGFTQLGRPAADVGLPVLPPDTITTPGINPAGGTSPFINLPSEGHTSSPEINITPDGGVKITQTTDPEPAVAPAPTIPAGETPNPAQFQRAQDAAMAQLDARRAAELRGVGVPTLAGALNAPQTPAPAPFLLDEGGGASRAPVLGPVTTDTSGRFTFAPQPGTDLPTSAPNPANFEQQTGDVLRALGLTGGAGVPSFGNLPRFLQNQQTQNLGLNQGILSPEAFAPQFSRLGLPQKQTALGAFENLFGIRPDIAQFLMRSATPGFRFGGPQRSFGF